MNCPKCNATLKEGARFCHVCGFDTQNAPVEQPIEQPVEQPVVEATPVQQPAPAPVQQPNNLNTNTMEQNQNKQPQQGFDFSKLSSKDKIIGIIGLVGVISVFLPFYRISAGFFGSYSVSMINAWQGVLSLLGFAGIITFTLFGSSMKMDEKLKASLPMYISFGILGLMILLFIQVSANSIPVGGLSIGFYLCVICALAATLVTTNVIKLNK